MTSSLPEGQGPTALLYPSDVVLRIKRARYADLCPCAPPKTEKILTRAALNYRLTIMSYDYMGYRGTEYDNPNATWSRMLAFKPKLAPMCFQFQRGRGKAPHVVDVYVLGNEDDREAISRRLLELATGRQKTLLPHYFDRTVKGRNPREDVIGWFDLRNAFCWFTDLTVWQNTARFLGADKEFPFRFVRPRFDKTFIITKPNETPDMSIPPADPVPGLCQPEAPTVALPCPQL